MVYADHPNKLRWDVHLLRATSEYKAHSASIGDIRRGAAGHSMQQARQSVRKSYELEIGKAGALAENCLELDAIRKHRVGALPIMDNNHTIMVFMHVFERYHN